MKREEKQEQSLSEKIRPDFPAVADFIDSVDNMEKNKAIGILEDYLKWAVSSEDECRYTWKELADAIQLGIDAMKGQKPAEWSEEDEKQIRQIERIVKNAGCTKMLQEKIHNWLKSLRPSWKPTEDEERLINTSISFLKDFADKGYENAVECIDWLKSKLNGNTCE